MPRSVGWCVKRHRDGCDALSEIEADFRTKEEKRKTPERAYIFLWIISFRCKFTFVKYSDCGVDSATAYHSYGFSFSYWFENTLLLSAYIFLLTCDMALVTAQWSGYQCYQNLFDLFLGWMEKSIVIYYACMKNVHVSVALSVISKPRLCQCKKVH